MLASDGGFTMRNRVINGCCRVKQRASVSLSTSNQFGEVDRMMGSYVNGSAGTFIQQVAGLASGMTFKRGVKFNDVTLSSGYITFRHRIEALNTLDLSGQTVTVSAKVYHDYGSTINVKIGLRKASASDNFSSTSAIGTDTTVAVATGTTTTVSGTYTLGSTDGDNGIEIVMYHDAASVTTKNFVIGDIELQLGTEVGPFERRSYGAELALCQRYCVVYGGSQPYEHIGQGSAYSTSSAAIDIPLPVEMRTTPSITSSGAWVVSDMLAGVLVSSFGLASGGQESSSKRVGAIANVSGTPLTVYRAYYAHPSNSTASRLVVNAEL